MYRLFVYLMVINELPIGMYLQNEYNNLRYRETNIDGQNRVREVQTHIQIRH